MKMSERGAKEQEKVGQLDGARRIDATHGMRRQSATVAVVGTWSSGVRHIHKPHSKNHIYVSD